MSASKAVAAAVKSLEAIFKNFGVLDDFVTLLLKVVVARLVKVRSARLFLWVQLTFCHQISNDHQPLKMLNHYQQ